MEMLRSLRQVSPLQSPLGEPVVISTTNEIFLQAAGAAEQVVVKVAATPVAEVVFLPVSGGNGDAYGLLVAFLVIVLALLVLRYALRHAPDRGDVFGDAFLEK